MEWGGKTYETQIEELKGQVEDLQLEKDGFEKSIGKYEETGERYER